MTYDTVHALAREIRAGEEYETYHRLRESVMGDATQAALINEFKKLQITVQMGALTGQPAPAEDQQRFSLLSSLLFSKPEVQQYLLAEMRLQQTMADIFRILTEAAEIDLGMPGGLG